MNCPNCNYILAKKQFGKNKVDHCDSCGSTLFQPNQINRISLEDAEALAKMKRSDTISNAEKFSPTDRSPLKKMTDESIPKHVTLLKSDTTGEIFAFGDDLVNFKKAQGAKINYYQTWNIPLPALRTVLIYSFIIVSTVSVAFVASRIGGPTSQTIQAASICDGGPQVLQVENQFVVSCSTKTPLSSKANIVCNNNEETIVINEAPAQVHLATLPLTCQRIRFVFSEKDQSLETEWLEL
ncbi:hypothetical protein A3F34_00830 [Candidatus Roizmanbacteria bacterium RIFCSPHIGHO2_12_FULL_44_10]|uniref:Transcription factor zinc-finger domain-containing protein n=1 Tax=Candidatus Roizmanbacteria bacterium RIFCSPHIGHO2_12_FULL_44_10 TaxID=1802054 RepID=A0A1F7I882_9BACT|nr:MAG: hypothetical protein A3F34_00830 [Candidatus Roizmanbacteria bacterium RIFCSPHIGHO2_12_FULL_44_10]